jgi:hypothetical protein
MVGARVGDNSSEYTFARCRWPVTWAETHAARRGEDDELIMWLGRRLRWMVVALDGEPSGGRRRVEQSRVRVWRGEGKVKTWTALFGLA